MSNKFKQLIINKINSKIMGIFGKLFGKREEIEEPITSHIDEAETDFVSEIEELQEELRKVKEGRKKIDEAIKLKEAERAAIPIAAVRISEIIEYNKTLESIRMPEILESSKANIEAHLNWFAKQEELYPNATWLLNSGAKNFIIDTKNKYNVMLYNIAEEEFNRFKIIMPELFTEVSKRQRVDAIFSLIERLRGFVDVKAENYKECFNELNALHYQVEELYSKQINL
jgi:hypothetical protein